MRCLLTASVFLFLGGASFAEANETDAILARTSDYCVIGVSDGRRLLVRKLVFGNSDGQKLRTDYGWPYPAGQRAIVYLSQTYDSIGASASRTIENGQVEVVNAANWPEAYRENPNYTASDLQTLPANLPDYILAVQQIAAQTRAKRLERAHAAFPSLLAPRSADSTTEYERATRLVNDIISDLHADDHATLQRMAQIIFARPESVGEWVRGEFAAAIAVRNFRPGFDAVRMVAFEDPPDAWSSAGAALSGLSRIGNAHDLDRMKAEVEAMLEAGRVRQVRYSLFRAMGGLTAHCYPEGSRKRDQWRKWFERICAHPTPEEEKMDGPSLAASSLHFIGNAETKALLQSLERDDPKCAEPSKGPSGTSTRGSRSCSKRHKRSANQ